jgi:hypothetical protein
MMNPIIRTNTKPTIGRNIVTIDITKAVPVSIVATTGLPIPAVVAVEAKSVAPETPKIAAAVTPRAIIANVQVISGLKLTTVDTITAVPKNAARGTATESSKLSTKEM